MNRKRLIIFFLSLLVVQRVAADNWISVGIPAIYRFAEKNNSSLVSGSGLSGTPSGYMVYGSILEKPFLGYEKYKISLSMDNSDEVPAVVDIEFYDIGLRFEQKYTGFLIGYGYGSVKIECKAGSCFAYDFEEGIARQYFTQLAVQIYHTLSLHLSVHKVMGENKMTAGSTSDQLVLGGILYAFGLKLN